MRFSILLLASSLLLLFCLFPTRNHYWDGIGFSLNIEGHSQDYNGIAPDQASVNGIYYNPNHLLFNLTGYLLFRSVEAIFPDARAFEVLRLLSICCAIGSAILVMLLLYRATGDRLLSFFCALGMSVSATWWKYATDANAYIPSTFLLVAAAFLLIGKERRGTVLAVGLLHAAAMLLHQIAIFFFPAALLILYQRSPRKIPAYITAAAFPVAIAYAAVWYGALGHGWEPKQFLTWITSNGSDVLNQHSPVARLAESFRSSVRLIFGGRISLARAFLSTPSLIALGMLMAAAITTFFRTVFRSKPAWRKLPAQLTGFLAVWIGSFGLFLLFWLTEYPYYRIFYLPALTMLAGLVISRCLTVRQDRVAASLVVFIATFNFTFYIYPYSIPEATPPVRVAEGARKIWGQDVLVLYKEFSCDNWMMRHFNNQTKWKRAADDHHGLVRQIKEATNAGHSVWMDTSVLGHIDQSPGMSKDLSYHVKITDHFGVSNRKHQMRFAKVTLLPAGT